MDNRTQVVKAELVKTYGDSIFHDNLVERFLKLLDEGKSYNTIGGRVTEPATMQDLANLIWGYYSGGTTAYDCAKHIVVALGVKVVE